MDDDSLDTDNGWQGAVQFLIIRQRDSGGDNIVEASSVEPGVAPLSDATVSNFTFVGGLASSNNNAFRLNSGTVGTLCQRRGQLRQGVFPLAGQRR